MKIRTVVTTLAPAVSLPGCVTTWNPLYTDKDRAADPKAFSDPLELRRVPKQP